MILPISDPHIELILNPMTLVANDPRDSCTRFMTAFCQEKHCSSLKFAPHHAEKYPRAPSIVPLRDQDLHGLSVIHTTKIF